MSDHNHFLYPNADGGNITISSRYEVPHVCGDYDDVLVIIDWLDESTHFPLVQRDYIVDHLREFPILESIEFYGVSINIYISHDAIATSVCWKTF